MNHSIKKFFKVVLLFSVLFSCSLFAKKIRFYVKDTDYYVELIKEEVAASPILSRYFENESGQAVVLNLACTLGELFAFTNALRELSYSPVIPALLQEQFDNINFISMNNLLAIARQYDFRQIIQLFRPIPIRFMSKDGTYLDVDRRIFLTSVKISKFLRTGIVGADGTHIIKHGFKNEVIKKFVDIFSLPSDQIKINLIPLSWQELNDLLDFWEYYEIFLVGNYRDYILDLIVDKLRSPEVLDEFLKNPRMFRGSTLEGFRLRKDYLVSRLLKDFKYLTQSIDKSSGGHSGPVYSLALLPNGENFISGAEITTEKTLNNPVNEANRVGFDSIKLWQLSSNQTFTLFDTFDYHPYFNAESVYSVAVPCWKVSLDERLIATGFLDGFISISRFDSSQNKFFWKSRLNRSAGRRFSLISSLAFSDDGNLLVAGSWDSFVRIWKKSPEGLFILIQQLGSRENGHTSLVSSVVITSDGKRIFSASQDRTIKVWDKNPAGQFILFQTLDLSEKRHFDAVNSIAITPDGNLLISGSSDNSIKIWQKNLDGSFVLFQTLDEAVGGHTNSVKSVAVRADGKFFVSGSNDETIKTWARGFDNRFYLIQTLSSAVGGHTDFVNCVAISANGEVIISGSTDTTIKIWNNFDFGTLSISQAMFIYAFVKRGIPLDLARLRHDPKQFLLKRYVNWPFKRRVGG